MKGIDQVLRSTRLNSPTRIGAAFLVIVMTIFPVYAQTPVDAFNRGNELYRKNQFQEALNEYETIIKQGYISSELYFNIGNANFRLNRIAAAILAYARAARMNPNDPDLVHNIKLVNLRTLDRIDPVPELFVFQWLRAAGGIVSQKTSTAMFVLSWSFMFVSLSVLSVLKRISFLAATRWLVICSMGGVIVFGGFMSIQHWEINAGKDQSIVIAPVVTAKSSPDDQGTDAFVIHEGLKVRMTDTVGDWIKIILPDGKVGWIRTQHCERI
ncbi:MAG TPA: tetratricopeptide repeat protein [Bacteroidota bacterium]|nr:tetratricopeptide repeat protein [Bacteroidota bacterium]